VIACLLALLTASALPTDFGEVPLELVPFCRYIVQRRAAEGLNRVVTDEDSDKYGTVYGGAAEDANIAWIAASAYRYEWSHFHENGALREKAFFLLDSLARLHADGGWDDGGHGASFGLHSFAWAVLSWLETGDVDEARARVWREAVAATTDEAMAVNHRRLMSGAYANPEFYYMAGLAAAWKVCGDERYLTEAAQVLQRYENVLFEGGGVSYFHASSPEHGYQQMVVKSVALYWDITRDEHAFSWLRRLAPYFPTVQHRSGLLPDAEQPWLKHSIYNPVNPALPGMLACILDDAANRHVADTATRARADNVANRLPSFLDKNPNWYNYHHTTYAATLLRLLERHALPAPEPMPDRRVFRDHGFRGVRSHWDDFTAAVGTRQMNDTLAGAYLADPAEPMLPLHSALDGVCFEVLWGDRGTDVPGQARQRAHYRCIQWTPTIHHAETDDFAAVSCLSRICSPHWADMPWIPGERWPFNETSDWSYLQHWAVWRDHLVGLGALCCQGDGGQLATGDLARVRWRLSPVGRELDAPQPSESSWQVRYGRVQVNLERLAERGGFQFGHTEDEPPPRCAWAPVLARPAPWQAGDFVHVATDAHPVGSGGEARFKALNEGAAALLVEPGAERAYLWVASLVRHWRQHELAVPPGVTVRLFVRDVELTPAPEGGPAHASLNGGQSAVWLLESKAPLAADQIMAGLTSGRGRGESRPQRN